MTAVLEMMAQRVRELESILSDVKAWDVDNAREAFKHHGRTFHYALPHAIRARIEDALPDLQGSDNQG